MSEERITDELRDYTRKSAGFSNCAVDMYRIADRIDEAHARAVTDAYTHGWMDAGPDHMDDQELEEHGLMRMPVDADGKVWHVGDVAEPAPGKPDDNTFVIRTMVLGNAGWGITSELVASANVGWFRHHRSTSAERIRAWCKEHEIDLSRGDMADLLAIADELEGDE